MMCWPHMYFLLVASIVESAMHGTDCITPASRDNLLMRICCRLHCLLLHRYDTMTSSLLSNVTFENYKFVRYVTNSTDWWYWQTPYAFRMLSHSDQYKPGAWGDAKRTIS